MIIFARAEGSGCFKLSNLHTHGCSDVWRIAWYSGSFDNSQGYKSPPVYSSWRKTTVFGWDRFGKPCIFVYCLHACCIILLNHHASKVNPTKVWSPSVELLLRLLKHYVTAEVLQPYVQIHACILTDMYTVVNVESAFPSKAYCCMKEPYTYSLLWWSLPYDI